MPIDTGRVDLDAMKLAAKLTVRVRIRRMREFRFRIWLAMLFIRLSVWISGIGLDVEQSEDSDGNQI